MAGKEQVLPDCRENGGSAGDFKLRFSRSPTILSVDKQARWLTTAVLLRKHGARSTCANAAGITADANSCRQMSRTLKAATTNGHRLFVMIETHYDYPTPFARCRRQVAYPPNGTASPAPRQGRERNTAAGGAGGAAAPLTPKGSAYAASSDESSGDQAALQFHKGRRGCQAEILESFQCATGLTDASEQMQGWRLNIYTPQPRRVRRLTHGPPYSSNYYLIEVTHYSFVILLRAILLQAPRCHLQIAVRSLVASSDAISPPSISAAAGRQIDAERYHLRTQGANACAIGDRQRSHTV